MPVVSFTYLFFLCTIMLCMSLICAVNSPLNTFSAFFLSISLSVYLYYSNVSDFMSYMLFLVYVGGLLVLMIYMVMVSSNHLTSVNKHLVISSLLMSFVGGLTLYNLLGNIFLTYKPYHSGALLFMEPYSVVILGLMLLYIFLSICNMVCVGGRSVQFGS